MKKFKSFCIGMVSLATIFAGVSSFASEDYQLTTSLTKDYIKWEKLTEEQKKECLFPRVSTLDIPEEFISEESNTDYNLREQILNANFEKNSRLALVKANGYQLSRYNLNDDINVAVKHQGDTNECWAFSMTSVLETNVAVTQNINKRFSPRHMDYSTVRTFLDGINTDNLDREPSDGGLATIAIGYLTNGRGAVLESDMPFEDNENRIYLSELDKPVDTVATETVTFPSVYKEYGSNGEIIYTNGGSDSNLKIYSDDEISNFRNAIKNHIVNYGAISAVTAGNKLQYYSNQNNLSSSEAYFCNDESVKRDHAVTIVGWDDNYSRDNFTGAAKPKNNGAYICLNSYGTGNFKNGYLYISYEDVLIESFLYGIKSSNSVDYNKIYQYNPTGENTSAGIINTSIGYIAEIFDRDNFEAEELKYVGINLPTDMSLKIYVNPTGKSPVLSDCTLVATTGKLSAGYHRIPVDNTLLTGQEFAIVIEEKTDTNRVDFSIEIAFDDSIYSTVLGNPGKSLFSTSGYSWTTLSSQNVNGFNMATADLTIKAFVDEVQGGGPSEPDTPDTPDVPDTPVDTDETITSSTYTIKGTYIYKVQHDTTVQTLKKEIRTNSESIKIYNIENEELRLTDNVRTGTKVKLANGTVYTIIVRGDTNCDGKISLVDLSKIVSHYGDEGHFGLSGNPLKAADLNIDEKITLTDISQMVNIVGHLVY